MSDAGRREVSYAERAGALVLRRLRRTFPDDYDRRCIYAAAGIRHLLVASGIDARLHAGDFLALVVSPDGSRAAMQGFGGGDIEGAFSHYWVETPRHLIDLGPHLLTRGSSFAAAPLPMLCWDKREPLPMAIRYRALQRYAPDARMLFPTAIAERVSAFLLDLGERWPVHLGGGAGAAWTLTGDSQLRRAERRDAWSKGVLRFEREADPATLPF